MDFRISMLWATPVLEVRNPQHAAIKEPLVRHCYELEKHAKSAIESNVTPMRKANLYESQFDFFRRDLAEIRSLRQFCGEALSRAVYKLYMDSNPPGARPPALAVDMYESWIHITRDGGYHEIHTHPNCSWCGIYYLEIGQCTLSPPNGINRFFSPIDIMYDDFGTLASPQKPISIQPEEGKLVLFPSYVRHLAVPYHGKLERIVVSFNSRVFATPGQAASTTARVPAADGALAQPG